MTKHDDYIALFDRAIGVLFTDAVRITLRNPSMAAFFLRMRRAQKNARQRRTQLAGQGIHVPPFMIVSVTGQCNLSCAGCYAQAQDRQEEREMTDKELLDLVQQARDLGVGIILLAGGEPLTRSGELLAIARAVPDVIFPVFTNGTLLDGSLVTRLRTQRNLIPVLSLEGGVEETDTRRGAGTMAHVQTVMSSLREAGIFFGTSLTVTRQNVETVTDEGYLRRLRERGCRLFFFVEYVPVREGTEFLVLTQEQRACLLSTVDILHDRLSGLFITLPGNEEDYGGCLAAGRGFVHVSPGGRLEACPFAPYSDTSVRESSLREALGSPLLAAIREAHGRLTETRGGCALWAQREWVRSLPGAEPTVGSPTEEQRS